MYLQRYVVYNLGHMDSQSHLILHVDINIFKLAN